MANRALLTIAEFERLPEEEGVLRDLDEGELIRIIGDILEANPKPVRQFLEGKETVLGFLIGQVMRATRGKANVHGAERLLKEQLAGRRCQE